MSIQLTNTRADHMAAATRAVVGVAPFIGPLLSEIVAYTIPNQRLDRITAFVEQLDEQVSHLNEDIRRRLREPPYVDLLETAMTDASRAATVDRRQQLASLVKNSLTSSDNALAREKTFARVLSNLNDIEMVILRWLGLASNDESPAKSEFYAIHAVFIGRVLTLWMPTTVGDFEEFEILKSYERHLVELGLARFRYRPDDSSSLRPSRDIFTNEQIVEDVVITHFGKMFLESLDLT